MRNSPTVDQNTLYRIRYIHGKISSPTSQIIVHHIMRATRVCRPPHPNGFLSSTIQTGWALFSINTTPPAIHKSVRMQTINISQRESSQSNRKVPKRRRLAPSWDVVDDRPPHQLVHGVYGITNQSLTVCSQEITHIPRNVKTLSHQYNYRHLTVHIRIS